MESIFLYVLIFSQILQIRQIYSFGNGCQPERIRRLITLKSFNSAPSDNHNLEHKKTAEFLQQFNLFSLFFILYSSKKKIKR
ncbi:hypothetical protein D0809_05265 [Flavobacterium circumlabens]|uniref:Uncharacterized protein n=1 Tax=Flavobacterium circumlabens TaxID=2133765 RepID=A0A4Y7UDR8_9FLAO|nr:hypothetical protein D0809_05265 [Flavobacterium circumlabens]